MALKTKREVHYREGTRMRNCGGCKHFKGDGKDCAVVKGPIYEEYDCDDYVKNGKRLDPRG